MLGSPTFAQTDPSPTPSDISPSPSDPSPSPSDPSPSPSPSDTSTPSPSPSDTSSPSPSPSPSDTSSPSPSPSASVSPSVSPSASPLVSPSPTTSLLASQTLISNLDAIIQGQATATFGGARTTAKLLAILGKLDKSGIPPLPMIESVERPFPVAGLAYWVDDWHAYRCCPKPHLHQGVDLMAAGGTPLLSVANGVITNKINDPAWSGLAVSISDQAGTRFSYAHLSAFAANIQIGQRVRMGQVIGYVGNTGDAAGGPTHLHFEVHPYGGVAVPPKPYVDRWLDDTELRAVHLVQRLTGKHVDVNKVDVSLWKNKLFELAQHEIQASNLLAVRQTAAAQVAKSKVDQQSLPYTLPVVLLALLGAGLLFRDRRRDGPSSRGRTWEPDEMEVVAIPEALKLAILTDMEAAMATTPPLELASKEEHPAMAEL
jgi:Peptidase family M23